MKNGLFELEIFFQKPVFQKENANWISEIQSITRTHNNTIHHSTEMGQAQTSKNINETTVSSNLREKSKKHKPKFRLGDLIRTADIKKKHSPREILQI